jgi:hypothetical protein
VVIEVFDSCVEVVWPIAGEVFFSHPLIQTRMECIITDEVLKRKDAQFKEQFLDFFPPDIPDVCDLPEDVLMNIKLKDEIKPMVARAYSCSKKYQEGWKTLIEQHLAAGRIRPSNSDYVSPAFIVPKLDPNVFLVLEALRKAQLYCSVKKSILLQVRLTFLDTTSLNGVLNLMRRRWSE